MAQEVSVTLNGDSLTNNETVVEYGEVTLGEANPTQTFKIINSGDATLTINSITTPLGYDLLTSPNTSLTAGNNTTFRVGLRTSSIGSFVGNIKILSDDAASPFLIPVVGEVSLNSTTIKETDMQVRYSGGVFNDSPLQSLGGPMSPVIIQSDTYDNLFESIVTRDTTQIFIDYRAFYVTNTNSSDSFYEVKVWIESQTIDGANIRIGIPLRNEIQSITFPNHADISNGYFNLSYKSNNTDNIEWDTDYNALAANIASKLNAINGLSNVIVNSVTESENLVIELLFSGNDGNKKHPALVLEENGLEDISGGTPFISLTEVRKGAPINDIATSVAFRNNAPSGITFLDAGKSNAFNIGTLRSGDKFYVWVERTIPLTANTTLSDDDFTLRISSQSKPN